MDGLQIANNSPEKEAVLNNRDTDKYPHAQTSSYNPSTANSQPLAPDYHQHASPQIHDDKPLTSKSRNRIPFGLSIIAYSLLVAAVILIICGAGFGGALGAVVAGKGKDCSASNQTSLGAGFPQSTATTTITATATVTATDTSSSAPTAVSGLAANYVPLLPSQVGTLVLNCTTGSSVYTSSGSQFQLSCDTNYPGSDIGLVTAYRLEDCVGACANLNTLTGTSTCLGVLFNANMQLVVGSNGGNCWLKSAIGVAGVEGYPPSVAAVLVASS